MSDELFYILSLRWSKRRDAVLSWWGPNNSDYVFRLERAGKYTRAQINEKRSYYDNGETTRAVPCDKAEAKAKTVGETESAQLDNDLEPTDRVVPFAALPSLNRAWVQACP